MAGYELLLYDQVQTDTLISLLGKTGTMVFKRTKSVDGAIEIDENGNEVKTQNRELKTFRVWENKHTGLSYFLSEDGEEKKIVARLIVIKRSTQFGKTGFYPIIRLV